MEYRVYLYGIGRNLKATKDLVDFFGNIAAIFSVTYLIDCVESVENPRSNDFGAIDYRDLERLGCPTIRLNLNKEKLEDRFFFTKKFRDGHGDNYKSNRNLVNQLMMLEQIQKHIIALDVKCGYIVLRDDICFDAFSKFFLKFLIRRPIRDNRIYISMYSWHKGFNDKLFISDFHGAKELTGRLSSLEPSTRHFEVFNAELLLRFVVERSANFVLPIPIRVARVRLDGTRVWDRVMPSVTRPSDIVRVLSHCYKWLY